jgi:hypothetical protein
MQQYHPLRSSLKILKLITVNLLVLFILLEVSSLGFFFLQTRRVFYTSSKDQLKAAAAEFDIAQQPGREGEAVGYQLHPYFGFISPNLFRSSF